MIRFICAQPATLYYAWQVEVMLYNFKEMGIDLNLVDIVGQIENDIPKEWKLLKENYNARFSFYKDTRKYKKYIYSIRPNLLKQHFKLYPELKNQIIFYHDCDIIFSKPIDWTQFKNTDIWYGSDTRWYLSYDSIIQKDKDVFDVMCTAININPQLVIDNNEDTIGAQYILKGVDSDFWERVELDSIKLFKNTKTFNDKKIKENPQYDGIKYWMADMWSLLWNIWKSGYDTKPHIELRFALASASIDKYDKCNIIHNSNITQENKEGLFDKSKFQNKLPYNKKLKINKETVSKKYYEWVEKTAKNTVLNNGSII